MTTDPAYSPTPDPGDDIFGPSSDDASPRADGPPDSLEHVGGPGAAPAEEPEPVYHAVEDWVIDHFLPMYRRTLGGEFRWCAQWWKHDEAVSRLTALWHAWEVLRLQPGTGMGAWYRDHLDHQLPILMGARGPFYQCSETTHREPHETITQIAPGEWWDTDGDTMTIASGPPALGGSAGAGDGRG